MTESGRRPGPARRRALGALTPREHEVLAHVADGLRTSEIAARLGIAEPTVKRHLTNLYGKLGARNRVEAVTCYLRGSTSPDPVITRAGLGDP